MENKPIKEIYEMLAAPFPESTIQRTKASETRRGYDTTGIAYQFIVNRLNEVAGLSGWNYTYVIIKELEGNFQSGTQFYDLTLEISIWVGDPNIIRKAPGGHRAASYADALKGALTNGLKKAAAMFGAGRQAYEGTLDDDNLPSSLPEEKGRLKEMPKSSPPSDKPDQFFTFQPGVSYTGRIENLRPRTQKDKKAYPGQVRIMTEHGPLTCYFFSQPEGLKSVEVEDWHHLIGEDCSVTFQNKIDKDGHTFPHLDLPNSSILLLRDSQEYGPAAEAG